MICKGCGSLMDYIGVDDGGCNYADTFADLYRCPECGEEDCQDGAPLPEDEEADDQPAPEELTWHEAERQERFNEEYGDGCG